MKKKIVSIILAAMLLMSCVTALAAESNRAILLCYDNAGKLAYSTLMKKGEYVSIPSEYESAAKKVYDVDSARFMTIEEYDAISGATPTAAPEETAAPTAAPEPTATPKATAKPAATPNADSPYEKAVDALYAPALVVGTARSVNANNEDVTSLTVYYNGTEMTVPVEDSVKISTAPEANAALAGQSADVLKKGDVICMTANVAGDKIKRVDLLFRPTDKDIATGTENYGTDFEKLFTTGGSVAGQWQYMKYGQRASRDKYQYAFGIIAKKSGNTLTLINKSTNPDDAIEIDLNAKAYVYSCDVSGKEYDFELGGTGSISSSLSSRLLDNDTVTLDNSYSYNYALVRVVDGEATDVVVFNNYND